MKFLGETYIYTYDYVEVFREDSKWY
jgi:hypothetical protein